MSENLASHLTETAAKHGDKTAVKLDDAELTYKALDGATAHMAGLLKAKGLEPGDRVGVMLPNVPYFPVVYYGILRAGGVVVPMNVLLKGARGRLLPRGPGREAAVRLARLRRGRRGRAPRRRAPRSCWSSRASSRTPWARPTRVTEVADRSGDDTAVILYTSGTTGKPKGAELSHSNLKQNCTCVLETLGQFDRGRRPPRRAAAVPLLRPDLRHEREHRDRRACSR